MSVRDIYNFIQVDERFATAGQPTAEQLRLAAADGFQAVVNLLPVHAEHALKDEAVLVRSLGMAYAHIPVEWGNPTEADFTAFERALQDLPAGKILIHCAANFRATAFFGLYAMRFLGWSAARADSFRRPVWQGSDYPLWEEFIRRMRAQIGGSG
jgi:uncharacterized protein (TIGR01244 family)